MSLYLLDGRGKFVIVAVDGILLRRRAGDDDRLLPPERFELLSDFRVVRNELRDNVARARKRVLCGVNALFFVDIFRRLLLRVGTVPFLREEKERKRFETFFLGDRRPRAALLLVGAVQVLHLGERCGFVDFV